MVKKLQKIMTIVLLVAIMIYAVKRHTDTANDFLSSLWKMVSAPLTTARKIQASDRLLGFPGGLLEIAASFRQKLPAEKEFFMSESLSVDPLFNQRMIEFSFPSLLSKEAKCGYVSSNEKTDTKKMKVIDDQGGLKIVCSL